MKKNVYWIFYWKIEISFFISKPSPGNNLAYATASDNVTLRCQSPSLHHRTWSCVLIVVYNIDFNQSWHTAKRTQTNNFFFEFLEDKKPFWNFPVYSFTIQYWFGLRLFLYKSKVHLYNIVPYLVMASFTIINCIFE